MNKKKVGKEGLRKIKKKGRIKNNKWLKLKKET